MPRGKFVNHKGRNRKFTSPEELEQERKNEEAKKRSRKQKVEEDGSDEESGSEEEGSAEENSEESESDSSEDRKAVGHHALIDIENPNRVHKKAVQKISSLTINPKAQSSSGDGAAAPVEQLSRREREEIEKQKSRDAYQKLHAEGKTDQAKADLARLAIIKQQRAEAAARREAEKKEKEAKQKPAAK